MDSIKRVDDWLSAAKRLGFRVSNGGKHPYTIRDPENPNDDDLKSLVATIPTGLHKIMNGRIAKEILFSPVSGRLGITEEGLWSALGFLKKK
ncbi:MAG: hypothetical protein WAN50_03480 [Minisyncoccia bacterium]